MPEPDLACFVPRALAATSPAFVEPRTVRFQDVDAAGIVFYPRILEYFHDAYVGFLASVDLPLPRVLAEQTLIAPVRRANAEFLRPMRFGDPIDVGLVCAVFVGSSLTLGYRIAGAGGGAVLAVGTTEHVFVDASFVRAPVPAAVLAAFAPLVAAGLAAPAITR